MKDALVWESPAGVTLIEVLVSISVALIALAALPATLQTIRRAATEARDGVAALALAQAKLEELDALGAAPTAGSDSPTSEVASTTFVRTWHVEPSAPRGEVRRLVVSVLWAAGSGGITLETFAWRP
jgi:prepilin-type N-terminal cleavage/methylation domain-containing protein